MTDLAVAEPMPGDAWAVPAKTAVSPSLPAEVLLGAEAYSLLAQDWCRLAEMQTGTVLFQSPELLQSWAHHFAADGSVDLVTVVVRGADGRTVLIWPLCIEKQFLLRIAKGAGSPVGQYDEMLLDPGCDSASAFASAISALMREGRPDLLRLERVRADGALRRAFADTAPLPPPEGAPYADLSGGMAEFTTTLKSRVTRQQKKRVRRFEQEGEVRFEVADNPEMAEDWLREAITVKKDWLRDTGRFSRAFTKHETIDCLLEFARLRAEPGAAPRTLVSRLTLDGRTAAIEMGFCYNGRYHLYLGAFTPEFAKFGAGNILTEKLMSWCVENGISRYDMLAPRSRNKEEWQSGEVEVFNLTIPTTLRGRFYEDAVLKRLLPAMRGAFYRLPPSLRSKVAGVALRKLGVQQPPADKSGEGDADSQ